MRALEATVTIEALSKSYGRKEVLREIGLSVERGECLALVGHNGAGKTTLMKLMLGLTRPSAGQVLVEGEAPTAGRRSDAAPPSASCPRASLSQCHDRARC